MGKGGDSDRYRGQINGNDTPDSKAMHFQTGVELGTWLETKIF